VIYFIQNAVNNHIKVGFTAKPVRRRRSNLQTGNSAKLVLLGMMQGDEAMETDLHQRFAEAHILGDWFAPIPRLLQFIIQACTAGLLKQKEEDSWPLFVGNHCGYHLQCPDCAGKLDPADPADVKNRFVCEMGHRWFIPIGPGSAEGRFFVRATRPRSVWQQVRG
jgi:hypothetical protein